MTQFYELTRFLAAAMFKKPSPIIPDGAIPENSEPGIVLKRIRQLLEVRSINVAENMLFDSFDKQKPIYAAIALEFYARLSELEEDELREHNFSVEEIGEGIRDMMKFYNIKLAIKKAPPKNGTSAAPTAINVMADPPKADSEAKGE